MAREGRCILRPGATESQVSSHRVDEVGVAGKYAPWGAIEVTTGKPWRGVSPGAALTLALALCPSIALALDPGKNIDQYGHDTWTSQNGLPREAVYQILQTRDGYLWLR